MSTYYLFGISGLLYAHVCPSVGLGFYDTQQSQNGKQTLNFPQDASAGVATLNNSSFIPLAPHVALKVSEPPGLISEID